jgi:hypothetical protein
MVVILEHGAQLGGGLQTKFAQPILDDEHFTNSL